GCEQSVRRFSSCARAPLASSAHVGALVAPAAARAAVARGAGLARVAAAPRGARSRLGAHALPRAIVAVLRSRRARPRAVLPRRAPGGRLERVAPGADGSRAHAVHAVVEPRG